MKNVYFGILAGGSGKRLWPLSNKQQPKQLLPFVNNKSLLQQTVERVSRTAVRRENIFVITSKEQEQLIKNSVGDQIGFVLSEPCGRNTGPAILLGCHTIVQKDPGAIVFFLPADHFIPDPDMFNNTLVRAITYIQKHDSIALFGLKPTCAATGYGYIQTQERFPVLEQKNMGQTCVPVSKFHEKPDQRTAQEYLARNDMFWNIGVFGARAKIFINEFKSCATELSQAMHEFLKSKRDYSTLPNISVDYAVMEKSKHTVLFPAHFEWHDVGNLHTFLSLKEKYSHQDNTVNTCAPIINIGGARNLASTCKKTIACIGVSDLCIVETDDVLLIVKKDKAELVKNLLDKT